MKNAVWIFLPILFLFSCQDQKMERSLAVYKGNAIRTDGYYFNSDCKVYFFFMNGTFRRCYLDGDSIRSLHDTIPKLDWVSFKDIDIYSGGFWQEDSLTFELQGWIPSEIVHKLKAIKVKVLDDSTFVMVDSWLVYDKDFPLSGISDTFHFQKTSFKPDSLYFERQKVK